LYTTLKGRERKKEIYSKEGRRRGNIEKRSRKKSSLTKNYILSKRRKRRLGRIE